jgi:hypothetical protein
MTKENHDLDWWRVTEFLPGDPWFYIFSDLWEADEVLSLMHEEKFEYGAVVIGGTPKMNSPEQRIEFAFSLAMNIRPEIELKIIEKAFDEELLWLWGEYQKAITILFSAYPEYKKHKAVNERSVLRGQKKRMARQWYTLWLQWYMGWPDAEYSTRVGFARYFEGVLLEIKAGERSVPSEWKQDVFEYIEQFSSDPSDETDVRLTQFYTDKFYGSAIEKTLELALANREVLPPVGEECYRKI